MLPFSARASPSTPPAFEPVDRNKAITDLRQQVFRHQLHLPMSVHQSESGGRTVTHPLRHPAGRRGALERMDHRHPRLDDHRRPDRVPDLTAWQLTLLIVAIAPLVAWLIRPASRKAARHQSQMQETTGRMTGAAEESLTGIREIKPSARTNTRPQVAAISERLRQQTMRTVRVSSANVPLVQVLAAAAPCSGDLTASALSAETSSRPANSCPSSPRCRCCSSRSAA